MSTKDKLTSALSKLQQNYLNVSRGLAQASAQLADMEPDVLAAAKFLVDKFKHPQGVMEIVKSVGQLESLSETKTEIEALIASLQVSIGEVSDEVLDAQLAANTEALKSPLPSAGSSSAIDPANQATLDEVSARAQAPDQPGNQGPQIPQDDGSANS